jgi:hypothetical protein
MRRKSTVQAVMFAALVIAAGSLPQAAHAEESQLLYQLGGNAFILREQTVGGTSHIRVYRQAGDQWERFGAGTRGADGTYGGIVARILRDGRYVGPSHVDLDDWMNTDLNRSFPEPLN